MSPGLLLAIAIGAGIPLTQLIKQFGAAKRETKALSVQNILRDLSKRAVKEGSQKTQSREALALRQSLQELRANELYERERQFQDVMRQATDAISRERENKITQTIMMNTQPPDISGAQQAINLPLAALLR